jgi:hypothetical protein
VAGIGLRPGTMISRTLDETSDLSSRRKLSLVLERTRAVVLSAIFGLRSEPEGASDHRGLGGGVTPWL